EAGQHVPPEQAAPLYVRDKVAFTTREREEGMGGNPKAPGLGVALRPMGQADVPAVADIEASVQSFPWTAGNFSDGLRAGYGGWVARSEEHTSELQSREKLVCRLLLEKKQSPTDLT